MYPIFKPTIFFDESEYLESLVSDETLVTIARLELFEVKDSLLFHQPKELDDTG